MDEKLSLMVELKCEHATAEQYKSSCAWGLKYLQENRGKHFAQLDEFRERVEAALKVQESKLRKLSIEYDEELYPHLMSAIAERRYLLLFLFFFFFRYLLTRALLYYRWLISHGLRLAAMGTLESQEVVEAFGKVV